MSKEYTAQELLDVELIGELKARYFRFVDAQDWEGFRSVFADDATFDLGDGKPYTGADRFVSEVRDMTVNCRTVHHGHMPEITIDGPTEAHGVWVLNDYLEWPSNPETGERHGVKGYGVETETYRKVDGEWKIASFELTYIRLDPLPLKPLPDKINGPAILDEATH